MTKLPDSSQETAALLVVAVVAGGAHVARLTYSRGTLSRRRIYGGVLTSAFLAAIVYGLAVMRYEVVSGFMGIIIGASVGLFTDDVLAKVGAAIEAFSAKPRKSRDSGE